MNVARLAVSVQILSGTSGWVYKGWRAHLYDRAPVRRWLEIASRAFGSLEINGSFYTQIAPATYARWYAETPRDFRFAVKGHRFVTHYKRLRDCHDSIARLRDQAGELRDKLAAVVWQLPAHFARDDARLADFLRALEAWPVRHALELRHASWFAPEVASALRGAGVAVCMADAPDFPMWRALTADFVYARLHGHTRKYASSYSAASLQRWADDARAWAATGHDVFVYFDNDAEGHAVANAQDFARRAAAHAVHQTSACPRARSIPPASRSVSSRSRSASTRPPSPRTRSTFT
jgi:uncharacterized protein YecE (DUF72 family)